MAEKVEEWQVRLDTDRCIGSGLCASKVPSHFRLVGLGSEATADTSAPNDMLIDAADACPAEAITVIDGADGRVLAP